MPSYLFEGDGCNVVVGDMAASTASQRAISALALALKQLDQVAIVRKNYSNSTAPRLAVLVPHCKDNYEVRAIWATVHFCTNSCHNASIQLGWCRTWALLCTETNTYLQMYSFLLYSTYYNVLQICTVFQYCTSIFLLSFSILVHLNIFHSNFI